MTRFQLILLLFLAHPIFGQILPDSSILKLHSPETFKAVFKTTQGDFIIEAFREWSPQGADRLYQLLQTHFFDNNGIFRVQKGYVIQFGISDNKEVNQFWNKLPVKDEPLKTRNFKGTVSFARDGPNTRTTQLFINLKDNFKLDTVLFNGLRGFPPIAGVISGEEVFDKLYSDYGFEPAKNQDSIMIRGHAYLHEHFPKIDYIVEAKIIPDQLFTDQQKQAQADKIKEACRFAWDSYKQYAWGYDVLKPISKQGENWYSTSFVMTPLDAYDTFILMGLQKEAEEAEALVLSKLTFDVDQEVQLFEVSIRLLGGLLSAYELSGNEGFLDLATDLGFRLIPAFKSPTGMPYRYVNLKTGKTRDPLSNPAEIGTYLLEFGKLTQFTGDSMFYQTAKKAAFEVFKRRSAIGLVSTVINVESGAWTNTESQIGARIDSYYEYLFKAWLLYGDEDCFKAWKVSNDTIKKYFLSETPHGWFFTRVDMNTGKETHPYYGALDAFYAGVLALSGDLETARKIQQGNYYMWTRFNMEPEEFDFRKDSVLYPNYPLRPENIESCFYLYRMTKEDEYLQMGKRMIDDILDKCRTDAGFAQISNVLTLEKEDYMESFFFAETLKYAYLLFAPESTLDLKEYVFTTEAHPLLKVITR